MRATPDQTADTESNPLALLNDGENPLNAYWNSSDSSMKPVLGCLWHSIVRYAPNNIIIADRLGTIYYANNTLSGRDPSQAVGTSVYDYINPEHHAEVGKMLEQVFQGGGAGSYVLRGGLFGPDSWYETQVGPVIWNGRVIGATLITRDISERKLAEEALAESEQKYRILVDNAPVPIVYYSPDGQVLLINRTGAMNLGSDPDSLIGKSVYDLLPSIAQEIIDRNRLAIQTGEERQFEDVVDLPWGIRSFISTITPMKDATGKTSGVQIISQDITERKSAEQNLRDLSHRLVEVQELERRHLARELHDQIGQELTGLKLLLQMVIEDPDRNIEANIAEAQDLIHDIMQRIGDLSLDLRPSMLDDLGLLPTLLWHFKRYTAQTAVRVTFRHRGLRRRLPTEIEVAIYRIVQEALTNVACHANTESAAVRIFVRHDTVTIQVHDEGIGFEPDSFHIADTSTGLAGMRERIIALGGNLTVNSKTRQGTDLVARLPLPLSANMESLA